MVVLERRRTATDAENGAMTTRHRSFRRGRTVIAVMSLFVLSSFALAYVPWSNDVSKGRLRYHRLLGVSNTRRVFMVEVGEDRPRLCFTTPQYKARSRIRAQHSLSTMTLYADKDLNTEKPDDDDEFDDDVVFDDDDDDDNNTSLVDDDFEMSDEDFLKFQLDRLEDLEELMEDIEDYCYVEGMCDEEEEEEEMEPLDESKDEMDEIEKLDELFSLLEDDVYEDGEIIDDFLPESGIRGNNTKKFFQMGSSELEKALLQGVVPVDAEVGRDTIPGDWGFDPLDLAERDYIRQFQYRLLTLLPGGNPNNDPPPAARPAALVLRDYREAEIRHGRLAMLSVIIWPLQEKLDKFFLDDDQFGPIIYGPVTLPYFPLLMTLIMMLLGYLDIYAKVIQEEDNLGDAFLPGDCFWDPLKILEGAPSSMKRNMQEREITNGRMAMIAFAAFVFEEAASHRALIDIPSNELLFEPAYQVPFIQQWLDEQFLTYN
jgi:light-harvesting complex I chlorophyll a/b binding protein 1